MINSLKYYFHRKNFIRRRVIRTRKNWKGTVDIKWKERSEYYVKILNIKIVIDEHEMLMNHQQGPLLSKQLDANKRESSRENSKNALNSPTR